MKKTITILLVLLSVWSSVSAQSSVRDSLLKELAVAKQDTNHVWLLFRLTGTYRFNQPDSAIYYGMKGLKLARDINYTLGEVKMMRYLAISHIILGNYGEAMQLDLKAIRLAEENNLLSEKRVLLLQFGDIYKNKEDYQEAIRYYKASALLTDSINNYNWYVLVLNNIGQIYIKTGQIDSAKFYVNRAHDYFDVHKKVGEDESSHTLINQGRIYQLEGNKEIALSYFLQAYLTKNTELSYQFYATIPLAEFYFETNDLDSSSWYAGKSLEIALKGNLYQNIVQSCNLLSTIYKQKDFKKALEFKEMAMEYQDSLFILGRKAAIQNYLDFDDEDRQREINEVKTELKNRLRMNTFLGSTFTLFVIAIFLFIIYRRKQKAKLKIESAFNQLKSTQAQLIQSEKMASLGELTAGIAHEIQNPLNFVNNFSEISNELVEELKSEKAKVKSERDEALEVEILNDISQNLEKINHHGKRAADIVKGMLQHSRTSSGVKEPTDINALADEYLRLAYHGLRAKDKSFNAKMITDFDGSIGKIEVVPQDFGRVILNLITNAFYVVDEKKKLLNDSYEPAVSVSTKKMNNLISISVKDNGNGIPKHILDKIFQPFFTTKPTGQGTGLGLSLAYDIVKAHGGELKVETKEVEGTEFIIQLPII